MTRCRAARLIVALSVAVLASTVPLYRWVKQEYVPTDVDEAEFEMLVEGPEGMSLAAMDEALQAIDREIRAVPRCPPRAPDAGAGSWPGSIRGTATSGSPRTRSGR